MLNTNLLHSDPPADIHDYRAQSWRARVFWAPLSAPVHALMCAIMGEAPRTNGRLTGKAIVTADGRVMCDFVDEEGMMLHAVHVMDIAALEDTIAKVIKAMQADGVLTDNERDELLRAVADWIAADHRRTH